jgi:hypothetical protein
VEIFSLGKYNAEIPRLAVDVGLADWGYGRGEGAVGLPELRIVVTGVPSLEGEFVGLRAQEPKHCWLPETGFTWYSPSEQRLHLFLPPGLTVASLLVVAI